MEGKKRYVAIVLFLLIGLTLFTFANPVEEQKGSKGNGSKDSEVTDKDTVDGTLGTGEQTQVQPQVQNQVADNSYANALAAVVKAEGSLETLDVEAARDLINRVTNQNQKDELTERLDVVEEAIDAIELVETLEKMVEEATDRDGILDSIDYRTDEEIIQKVDALRNEDVQESLKDRLQILSRILDDNTAPEYDGVEDNEITNKDVSLTYSDTDEETGTENEVTVKVTLDGEEIDYAETFTKEGTYVVTLTDEAFNETTVTFTIDKTAPKFVGIKNGNHYETIKVEVDDANATIVVKNMDKNETTEVANGTELTEDATYYITATDEAGNETSIWVAIDTTAPTITGVDETKPTNKNEIVYVKDKFLTSVTIDGKEYTRADFEVGANNENFSFQKKVTHEGTHTVVAVDKAGNKTTKTFVIDKTAAKKNAVNANVNGYKNEAKEQYATNGNTVTAYISVNEELKHNPTFTFYTNGKEVKVVGKEEVIASVRESGDYPYVYTAKLVINEELVAEDGVITFKVTDIYDKAGNQTADITKMSVGNKTLTLDRTAPERVYSTVRVNKTEYNENGTKYYYVKNGDSFEFAISFNELLKEVPTVTIGGRNVEMKLNEKVLKNENKFLYEGTFEIPANEKELKQGTLEIKVSNVKDIVGNEATSETVTNQTKTSNGRTVVYDCKNPVVSGVNNKYYYNAPITITAVDYHVHNVSPIETTTIDGVAYALGTEYAVEGTHEFVAYDRAGNRLRVTFTIDLTDPEITGVEDGKSYNTPVTPVITDANIDTIKLNDNDFVSGTTISAEGKYTLVATDKAGRTTIVTFIIDTTPANIALAGTEGLNKNEMRVESGTEVTLDDVLATVTDNFDETTKIKPYKADLLVSNVASENTYNYDFTNGFNTRHIGRYNIYYEYTDKAGNKATATMLLVMTDTTPATITLPENGQAGRNKNEMHVESGTKVTLEDVLATVTDNVDETVKIAPYKADLLISNVASENKYNYDFTNGFDTRYVGRYNIYYTYTDKAGHVTNKTMLLVMTDTTAPTISIPGTAGRNHNEYIVEAGTHVTVEEIMATVTDNVDATTKIKPYKADLLISNVASENTYNYDFTNGFDTNYSSGRYNLYYEYTDKAGHTTKAGMMIVFRDTTAPTITVADGTIGTGPYKKLNLKMHDQFYIASVVINGTKLVHTGYYVDINDGDAYTFQQGTNTVVVTDKAGNVTTKTFVIDRNTHYVYTFADLKEAFNAGGTAKIMADIEVIEMLELKDSKELVLDMNGHKLTINDTTDPMMDIKKGTKLTITGNGTFDLEDHKYASLMYPRGEVIIENGNFLRATGTNKSEYGSFFVGISGSGGAAKIRIYDGYFDGGYYVEGDEFNNSRTMLNASWGQDVKVYGGTFVGQNPAYGDEGMAYTNPNSTSTYCQAIFFEGQTRLDTEIPSTYTVEKGTLADGRPTYKVIYTPSN